MAGLAQRRIGGFDEGNTSDPAESLSAITKSGDTKKLADKLRKQYRDSFDSTQAMRAKWEESFRMAGGGGREQWGDDAFDRRNARNRPALSINKMHRPLQFLEGTQRQQRTDVVLLPFEGGDIVGAVLMTALYKWFATQGHEAEVDSAVLKDTGVCGMGWWKHLVDFEDDAIGRPVKEWADPLSVFPDPHFYALRGPTNQAWQKANYVQHATFLTKEDAMDRAETDEVREQVEKLYGNWIHDGFASTGAGDGSAAERSFWDPETQRIQLLECWYIERLKMTVAIDGQEFKAISDPDIVKRLQEAVRLSPALAQRFSFSKRLVPMVRRTELLDQVVLSDDWSPHDRQALPFTPNIGFKYWREVYGLVEPMKDPQKLFNAVSSGELEIIMRMARSGWKNAREKGAALDDLEKFASGEGVILQYDTVEPQEINPPPLPNALVYMGQKAEGWVSDVLAINPESTGGGSQRTVSGKALGKRQEATLVAQEPLLDSFMLARHESVRWQVKLIQQYVPVPLAMRILGTIALRASMTGAPGMPTPAPDAASKVVQQTPPPELERLLNIAYDCDFDIVISDIPFNSSLALGRWDRFQEALAEFGAQNVPPEVITRNAVMAGVIQPEDAAAINAKQEQMQQQGQPSTTEADKAWMDMVATAADHGVEIAQDDVRKRLQVGAPPTGTPLVTPKQSIAEKAPAPYDPQGPQAPLPPTGL